VPLRRHQRHPGDGPRAAQAHDEQRPAAAALLRARARRGQGRAGRFRVHRQPLAGALDALEATTKWLQESYKQNPDDAGFGAADFLRAFALTMLGYDWLRMARAAARGKDAAFAQAKRATAEFFAQRLLPQAAALCAIVRNPAQSLMDLPATSL
jgi:hypothetical protein